MNPITKDTISSAQRTIPHSPHSKIPILPPPSLSHAIPISIHSLTLPPPTPAQSDPAQGVITRRTPSSMHLSYLSLGFALEETQRSRKASYCVPASKQASKQQARKAPYLAQRSFLPAPSSLVAGRDPPDISCVCSPA